MARYVLVEFDDNAAAQRFVEKVNGEYAAVDPQYNTRRVRAVWGKPTRFCDCDSGTKGANPYRRGEKSGWWLHAQCGRPSRFWALGNHWFSALGRNLLPGNDDYMPAGWGIMKDFDSANIIPTGPSDAESTRPTGVTKKRRSRRDRPRRDA